MALPARPPKKVVKEKYPKQPRESAYENLTAPVCRVKYQQKTRKWMMRHSCRYAHMPCGYRPFYQPFWSSVVRILARQVYVLQARDWTTLLWGNWISQENLAPPPAYSPTRSLQKRPPAHNPHLRKVSSWLFSVSPLEISNQDIWEMTHSWGEKKKKDRTDQQKEEIQEKFKNKG